MRDEMKKVRWLVAIIGLVAIGSLWSCTATGDVEQAARDGARNIDPWLEGAEIEADRNGALGAKSACTEEEQ